MATVIPLRPRQPRFTPGIAAEAFVEVQAQLHTVRAFVARELRDSWQRGRDTSRMRDLQRVDAAVRAIDTEAKRYAAWADAACADSIAEPGHGRAA